MLQSFISSQDQSPIKQRQYKNEVLLENLANNLKENSQNDSEVNNMLRDFK